MIKELKEVVAEFERLESLNRQKDAQIKRLQSNIEKLNEESISEKELRRLKKQIHLLKLIADKSDYEICTHCGGDGGFTWETEFDAGGEECPKCLGSCIQNKEKK